MKQFTILLALFLGFLSMREVKACSCNRIPMEEELKYTEAVITGRVISQRAVKVPFKDPQSVKQNRPYYIRKATIRVLEKYKGSVTKKKVTVYTALNEARCGFRFRIGKKYIIYADSSDSLNQYLKEWIFPVGENIFWTDLCRRTGKYTENEAHAIEKMLR